MMTTLHFAHLSDIHISVLGDHHDMLSGHSAVLLANIFAALNRVDDLDFVLITGDVLDTAHQAEFNRFQQLIRTLTKPYYILPGNHDRRELDDTTGLTRCDFARHFNPQFADRPSASVGQAGYWSVAVSQNVQLIGLDSPRDEDWGGIIDAAQMAWLEHELAAHAAKLVILAVHHPFHALAPIDHHPHWTKFVCDNGPDMLALLNRYPQVKLVLTGHHHQAKVDHLGARLHISCPAVAVYPCAYRTFRLSQDGGGTWTLAWQTHFITDESTRADARRRFLTEWQKAPGGFTLDFVEDYARLALGSAEDWAGPAELR
jgi:3',5'-cyclic-AMP phosphodiesterase